MLRRLDSLLAPLTWIVATALAVMLLVGPQLVAEDRPEEREAGAAPYASGTADGRAVFAESCGSCHTLSAAGTSGAIGPRLDGRGLDAAAVEEVVRSGRGAMPAFEGRLGDSELDAVAKFVAEASR